MALGGFETLNYFIYCGFNAIYYEGPGLSLKALFLSLCVLSHDHGECLSWMEMECKNLIILVYSLF